MVREVRQRNTSKYTDGLPGVETVVVIQTSLVAVVILILTQKWKSRLQQSPNPKMNSLKKSWTDAFRGGHW